MNRNTTTGDNEDFNTTLFDARNFFYIGNYMSCINTVLQEQSSNGAISPELHAYLYYSYLLTESERLIASEIKKNETGPLIAFHHLYEFLEHPEKRNEILEIFTDKLQQDRGDTNIWQICASIAFCKEGMYEKVLKLLHDSEDLECMAITIQFLLSIHRVDLARQVLAKMQEKSDDATITQLSQAWVNIHSGGEQLQDAFHIYQEFCEKYTPTPLLLNGQAICHIEQDRYEEAEVVLKDALTKKHNDFDTLINMIVLSHLTGKSHEVIDRYLEQLRQFYPNSNFVRNLQRKEDEFDRLCLQYEPKNKITSIVN